MTPEEVCRHTLEKNDLRERNLKMALLRFPQQTKIDFVGLRFVTLALSGAMIALTLIFYLMKGFNYGIDFRGGVILEIRTPQPAVLSTLRQELSEVVEGEISLQEFGSPRDVLIRLDSQAQQGSEEQLLEKIKTRLGPDIEYRRIETIGPKVGAELIRNGLIAIAWALVAMLIYVWFRFEWQFGICAVIALLHDCIGILGLFTGFQLEFNETAIVALLITASYSINDTVVIFDRIRENRQKYRKMTLIELINTSVNETLARTTFTSATTLIALLALYLFGGHVIAAFSLPILVGIGVGTYSSIFLATPLLLYLRFSPQKETSLS